MIAMKGKYLLNVEFVTVLDLARLGLDEPLLLEVDARIDHERRYTYCFFNFIWVFQIILSLNPRPESVIPSLLMQIVL